MVASPRRRQGLARRLLGLSATPAVLVIVLILGLFIFNQSEPVDQDRGGRTSDIAYARDPCERRDRGRGHRQGTTLGRLPGGPLTASGGAVQRRSPLPVRSCTTTIRGTIPPPCSHRTWHGWTADSRWWRWTSRAHRLFLADEARNGERLEVLDLTNRARPGRWRARPGWSGRLRRPRPGSRPIGSILFTLGTGGATPVVVRHELGACRRGRSLGAAPSGKVALAPMPRQRGVRLHLETRATRCGPARRRRPARPADHQPVDRRAGSSWEPPGTEPGRGCRGGGARRHRLPGAGAGDRHRAASQPSGMAT